MISADQKRARAASRKRYYTANKEKMTALSRDYFANNPEKVSAYQRVYRAANREKLAAHKRAYHKANRERAASASRVWRAANPEKVRLYSQRGASKRRAIEHGAFVENVDYAAVFERDEGFCGICYTKVDPNDWHLDHVQPLSKGGKHSYDNVQVSHPHCNQTKSASI